MVENKNEFGGDTEATIFQDPPLVSATAIDTLQPEPSAPVEFQAPSYEETMADSTNEAPEIYIIPPPSDPILLPAQNDGGAATQPSNSDEEAVPDIVMASGTTAAVLGFFFLGGPIGAIIMGFLAAYSAQKEGAAGDVARTVGDIGVTVSQKAKAINDKHHIVDRSAQAARKAWESAKEYDRQHHVLDKAVEALIRGWNRFVQFVHKHKLLERGVESAGRGYEFMAERLSSNNNGISSPSQPRTSNTQGSSTQNHSRYSKVPKQEASVY
jgi:hypothetical protein